MKKKLISMLLALMLLLSMLPAGAMAAPIEQHMDAMNSVGDEVTDIAALHGAPRQVSDAFAKENAGEAIGDYACVGYGANTISVGFSLLGDKPHGQGAVHTQKAGNLETWIAPIFTTVENGATAGDVIKKLLTANGYSYTGIEKGYIDSITTPNGVTLSELTNGQTAGWMFLVNGASPTLGMNDLKVSNGDSIVFFYTDDYTKEEGYEPWYPPEEPATEFTDVPAQAWYHKAVEYVSQSGIMNGVSEASFAPNGEMSRAMLVTVLYRMESEPAASYAPQFTDVTENQWYTKAVMWAKEKGMVEGLGDGSFGVAQSVTRQQMAVMLCRYALYKGIDVKATNDISSYLDSTEVEGWALDAMLWANAQGLIKGTDAGLLAPRGSASRAQVAEILMRYISYAQNAPHINKSKALCETAAYIQKSTTNPIVSSIGGEWAVIGLARSDSEISSGWTEKYSVNLEQELKKNNGVLSSTKYTEYSRAILALTAIGKNPKNIGGYDLTARLADFEGVAKQGINGAIWALIALDSGKYEIPQNLAVSKQATKKMYLDEILSKQLADGGFSLTGKAPADADLTAMALCALSSYSGEALTAAAIDRALDCLSKSQNADGSFGSSCESTAQTIIALSTLKISENDSRFVKDGKTALDGLMRFYIGDGQFKHEADGVKNQMSTEQAMLALCALERIKSGKSAIFDMK